jgi:hypothetical protein
LSINQTWLIGGSEPNTGNGGEPNPVTMVVDSGAALSTSMGLSSQLCQPNSGNSELTQLPGNTIGHFRMSDSLVFPNGQMATT